MGKSQKPRKKYSDNHSKYETLFTLSQPRILSLLHTADGRKKLWDMTEDALKANPQKAAVVNSIRRKLMMYDELQGVKREE